MKEKDRSLYKPEWEWYGRSLENYKRLHPKASGAKTLTEARRLAFGPKQKRFTCCKDGCCQCAKRR